MTRVGRQVPLAVLLAFLALAPALPVRGQNVEPKQFSILIDDFEPAGAPDMWKYHKQAPAILMAALSEVFSTSQYVQLSFVERDRLTQILKERELPEKLPRSFDTKTIAALRLASAGYVMFCQYQKVKEDTFRIEAQLMTVETGSSVVAVSDSFRGEDADPFRGLALELKTQLYRTLKLPLRELHYRLIVCKFEPIPPGEAMPLFPDESVLGGLQRLHLAGIDSVAPDVAVCSANAGPAEDAGAPDSELRVTGTLVVTKDQTSGRRKFHLYVKIRNRQRGLAADFEGECEEEALVTTLATVADRLRREWQATAIKWAETPAAKPAGEL